MIAVLSPARASTTNKLTLYSHLDGALNESLTADWVHSPATRYQLHNRKLSEDTFTTLCALPARLEQSIPEGLLAMSQMQIRVQEKDPSTHGRTRNSTKVARKENTAVNGWSEMAMKRKAVDYEEDIEGFQFSRTSRSKKPRSSPESAFEDPAPQKRRVRKQHGKGIPTRSRDSTGSSSETPNGHITAEPSSRRSKRLANDVSQELENPSRSKKKDTGSVVVHSTTKKRRPGRTKRPDILAEVAEKDDTRETSTPQPQAAGAKIALPFADTPVIERNKEMRQDRGRGQRRSSFGMRGRRASSLIDSGASNALPHDKVDTADFYKHIESEDLSEPRRMRQLLTWCATRAMGEKPSGSRSDDESAKLAARVIQEEMLKEFSNRSELSDWFSREETTPPAVIVKKPNPKNVQNLEKIKELEDHIHRSAFSPFGRLQAERQSLAALLRPPSVPNVYTPPSEDAEQQSQLYQKPPANTNSIDSSLLDPSQQSLLDILREPVFPSQPQPPPQPSLSTVRPTDTSDPISSLASRLSSLSSSLAPTLDSFAAGIHGLELYRSAADNVASGILKMCARRLEERDLRAMARLRGAGGAESEAEGDDDGGGGVLVKREEVEREDLRPVLGALSRLERR
ncbi:hypothetical protein PRK78_004606 [Emydomyces testavorans]|uniref:Mis12-Mtw1 family protein n=1 Tax=Emydomyces testavorans TaxID=2070801 RepID=A0AAF0DK72_9EURO|nr:hypothetical protein PRK78_004606 [Emydomyces testavorans]